MKDIIWFVYGNDVNSDRGYTILKDNPKLSAEEKRKIIDICSKFGNFTSKVIPPVGEPISYMYLPFTKNRYLLIRVVYLGKDYRGREGAVRFDVAIVREELLRRRAYNPFLLMRDPTVFEANFKTLDVKSVAVRIITRGIQPQEDPLFLPYAYALNELLNRRRVLIPRRDYKDDRFLFEALWVLLPIEMRKKLKLCTYSFGGEQFWDIAGVNEGTFSESFRDLVSPKRGISLHSYVLKVHSILMGINRGNIEKAEEFERLIREKAEAKIDEKAKTVRKRKGKAKSFKLFYLLIGVSVLLLSILLLHLHPWEGKQLPKSTPEKSIHSDKRETVGIPKNEELTTEELKWVLMRLKSLVHKKDLKKGDLKEIYKYAYEVDARKRPPKDTKNISEKGIKEEIKKRLEHIEGLLRDANSGLYKEAKKAIGEEGVEELRRAIINFLNTN